MELLAPAGNLENFHAAIEAGADAVYVGAPGLNARNLAREPRLEEIGAMIQEVRSRGRKIYIALNSLVKEQDLAHLIDILAYLEKIPPDALLVQDLGILNLVMEYFPSLELHASTLMTVHNSAGVEVLSSLGFSRVVAAREMTIKELAGLVRKAKVEIEVFVHGAMCFSYSGLCLFSSYLGGKSGLRGNCVQPCRRKYSIASGRGKGSRSKSETGYYFSMNDLSGLELVPQFIKMGIASLKIEGRLRSATYVENIVKAYRMVIDAGINPDPEIIEEAHRMIPEAMGRRTSTGYFFSPQPKEAIVAYHSGNIGKYLGRVLSVEQIDNQIIVRIYLKDQCSIGDRLRIHFEKSGKRTPFSVKSLIKSGDQVNEAAAGEKIGIVLPANIEKKLLTGKIELFRVDRGLKPGTMKSAQLAETSFVVPKKLQQEIKAKSGQVKRAVMFVQAPDEQAISVKKRARGGRRNKGAELWVRLEDVASVFEKVSFTPDKYLLNLHKKNLSLAGQLKRFLGRNMRSVIWALPPVMNETSLRQIQKDIDALINSGFRSFQIAHISQIDFFEGRRVQLYGDYSLNLLNSQAMALISRLDFRGTQVSIETDKETLMKSIGGYRNRGSQEIKKETFDRTIQLGITVYGIPPLFVSRVSAHQLVYGKTLVSPKNEQFVIERKEGYSLTRPQKAFSLLPYQHELEAAGINYMVIDLTGMKLGRKELTDIGARLSGKEKGYKLPTFNYLGTLE